MLRSSAAAGKGGRILAAKQVNPTRMELTRLKKKRITAIRGHKLLKDKRDELMRQYLDLDGAVKSLADVLPDMIRLAECEKACQLMAAEIEKTRRRVNALEHVIIPETEQSIKYITMKLDENERSTQIRLMKVKDMMLEETHHYSEK